MSGTQIFKPSPSAFIKQTFEIWLLRFGWILSLPVIACLIGAFFRWEWIVVALVLCLIVYPFGLMMLYFRYGMSDDGIRSIRPQQIIYSDISLEVRYLRLNSDNESFTEIEKSVYTWNVFRSVSENKKGYTLRFKAKPMKFVFVPSEALGEDKVKFTEILKENGILFV